MNESLIYEQDPSLMPPLEGVPQQPLEPEAPPPMPDEEVVAQVLERFDRSLEASDGIREAWNKNYQAYTGEYDLGPKLKHQSKIALPLVSRSVLFKAARLKSALVSGTDSFYALKGRTEESELVGPIHKALIDANLEEEHFPEKLESNTVAGELTSGQAWIVYPDPSGGWSSYIRIEPVDLRQLLRDPTGRGKYHIQARAVDATDLEAMAVEKGWNLEAVRELVQVQGGKDERLSFAIEQAAKMQTMDPPDQRRKTTYLYEYWGPLHRNDGTLESAMEYVVIGNRSRLLHRQTDPHGDGRDVYVDNDLLPNPFGVYAKSDMEDSVGLATVVNRLLNAMVDGAAFDVHRVFLADLRRIRNLGDLTEGLQPGLVIDQDGSPADPAIAPLNVGHLPPELFSLYQAARQEYEAGTEVTDLVRGLPQQAGTKDQTATEFLGKSENAGRALDALSKALEEKILEPLLQRMVYYQGQYADLRDPQVQRLAGPEIRSAVEAIAQQMAQQAQQMGMMPDPSLLEEEALDRVQELMREPFTVRVRGISGVLAREAAAQKLGVFVQAAISLEAQSLLDVPGILERYAHLTDMDPNDALLDDFQIQWLQQAAQSMAGQMAQQMVASMQQQAAVENASTQTEGGGNEGFQQSGGVPQ